MDGVCNSIIYFQKSSLLSLSCSNFCSTEIFHSRERHIKIRKQENITCWEKRHIRFTSPLNKLKASHVEVYRHADFVSCEQQRTQLMQKTECRVFILSQIILLQL